MLNLTWDSFPLGCVFFCFCFFLLKKKLILPITNTSKCIKKHMYIIYINISIYCISFFVKAVLSYKCMDAMHHGLWNKKNTMICTHRDLIAGNEIKLPCLCIVCSVSFYM